MKKIKVVIIVMLSLIELSSIYLAWKSLSVKETKIDDVKFQEEVSNNKKKKSIAIMLNEGSGEYVESTSNSFPTSGYIYNSDKSGCIDTTGKEVVNVLEYENGKVNLKLNQKVYCYLYFDKKEKPIIDKFYINDETSNKTTKVPEVTIHLKWSDPYIKEYCISETTNIDNCTWTPSNGLTEISQSYTFSSEGGKTFYAYIKDKAEGISEVKSNSIEYKLPITGESIVNKPIPGVVESTGVVEDELAVRYYGTNPANYICFGTNDKNVCTSNQDKYMYRIIGITKETTEHKGGMFKVIKTTPIKRNGNTIFYWHNTNSDTKWSDSDLYKGLNGISGGKYSNLFLGTTTYVPNTTWSNKIVKINWKYGDNPDSNSNKSASQMVQIEQAFTTTVSAKIGLMYLSDYYYAYQKEGLNCGGLGQYKTCATSWIHYNIYSEYDWTMTRLGLASNGLYSAWGVYSSGTIGIPALESTHFARPVFYLKSTIELSGSGTQSDPYIIVT